MTDESKSLMELLNEFAPSLHEVTIQQKGTTMDIIKERAKTHGDYKSTSAWSQSLKDMFRSGGNWHNMNDGQKEALEMIAVKLARLLNGNPQFPDHWDDISGYGKLGANSIERVPDMASLEQALNPPTP